MNFDWSHYLRDVFSVDRKCISPSEIVNAALLLSENQDEMKNLLSGHDLAMYIGLRPYGPCFFGSP